MSDINIDTKYEDGKATVHAKFLRNLGNFNNVSIELGFERSKRSGETDQDVIDSVFKLVEDNLVAKAQEIETELNGFVDLQRK